MQGEPRSRQPQFEIVMTALYCIVFFVVGAWSFGKIAIYATDRKWEVETAARGAAEYVMEGDKPMWKWKDAK